MVGYCYLNEVFFEEAPPGELDVEPEVWDEKRVREREARNLEAGRTSVATVALAPGARSSGPATRG